MKSQKNVFQRFLKKPLGIFNEKPMMVLLFILQAFLFTSFVFVSCSKDDNDIDIGSGDYSDWREVTDADSAVFANARQAFMADTANISSQEYQMLQFLPEKPLEVRTKIEQKGGMNYQFNFSICEVTVFKGDNDEVGKIIEVITSASPGLIYPARRDTITD